MVLYGLTPAGGKKTLPGRFTLTKAQNPRGLNEVPVDASELIWQASKMKRARCVSRRPF